jgi:hypothetical protein
MQTQMVKMINDFEHGRLSRRQLIACLSGRGKKEGQQKKRIRAYYRHRQEKEEGRIKKSPTQTDNSGSRSLRCKARRLGVLACGEVV